MLWEECAAVGMPRAVVITKIDHQRADFDEVLAACQDAFGDGVAPLYLPVVDQRARERADRAAVAEAATTTPAARAPRRDPDPDVPDRIEEHARRPDRGRSSRRARTSPSWTATSSGEEIDAKVLIEDLEKAVARGSFYPVLAASAPHGVGMAELLEVMTAGVPVAARAPAAGGHHASTASRSAASPATPTGRCVAEVVKTTSDPYVGRISLVRVFSGTLRPDMTVHVSGHGLADRGHEDHDVDERVGALTSPLGKQQRTVPPVRGRRHLRGGQAVHAPRPATRCRTRTSRC